MGVDLRDRTAFIGYQAGLRRMSASVNEFNLAVPLRANVNPGR